MAACDDNKKYWCCIGCGSHQPFSRRAMDRYNKEIEERNKPNYPHWHLPAPIRPNACQAGGCNHPFPDENINVVFDLTLPNGETSKCTRQYILSGNRKKCPENITIEKEIIVNEKPDGNKKIVDTERIYHGGPEKKDRYVTTVTTVTTKKIEVVVRDYGTNIITGSI